jgi:hypothetical protein
MDAGPSEPPSEYYQHFERWSHWWLCGTQGLVADIVRGSVTPGGTSLRPRIRRALVQTRNS